MISNAYYFSSLQKIGGIETFLYQIVSNNLDKKIVIYYRSADIDQLIRLNKYCTCIKYTDGMKIKCDKFFCNFNIDPVKNGDVEANKKILIVHGNYKWLNGKPPMHPEFDEVYAVSKDSADAYTYLTGIPCKVLYNPLTIEKKKTLMLMSATRIDTITENVKGGSRMIALSKALDQYCKDHNCSYQWHAYSNQQKLDCNIQVIKPTLDIAQYMQRYDYVIQLSDNFEGFNYTINESLMQNVPIVSTHCDVYKELGITDQMAIWLDFDLSNINEVVEQMFDRKFNFSYMPPKSAWHDILSDGGEDKVDMPFYRVKATDAARSMNLLIPEANGVPNEDDEFIVSDDRLSVLTGNNPYHAQFIKDIRIIVENKQKDATEQSVTDKPKTKAKKGK